jgi:UDP-N-acetylmuramoyl-tripeptide--D-alanyl-D-alanine ligase
MSQVARALDAEMHGEDVMLYGVSKDTRDIREGDLYVALIGERFDGHAFIADAGKAGAAGALVSQMQALDIPQVKVDDTREALGRLAAYWRSQFSGKLIGITGSNGKTSVKEMCSKILGDYVGGEAVLATRGNLNNDIGVPMMLLELREQHRYAVIEMGANHVGEIGYLTNIAKPDVALVNNVGPAHLEGFGSLDNTAKAKGQIYDGLDENGTAVINDDDVYSSQWKDYCRNHTAASRIFTFSMRNPEADAFAKAVGDGVYLIITEKGSAELALRVPGEHNVMNALAAISATLNVGLPLSDIISSLCSFENIGGRLTVHEAESGCRVIDDSYNANPLSVSAAIKVLASFEQPKVLVLGDMAELGGDAESLHAEVGELAKQLGIDRLYAAGPLSRATVDAFGRNGFHFDGKSELIDVLQNALTGDEVVLVKGSRSAAMEEVVERILSHKNNDKRAN